MLTDETNVKERPWRFVKHEVMRPGFEVSSKKANATRCTYSPFEQVLLEKLIAAQKWTGGMKPLKPHLFKEEPRKWWWEMRKAKNDPYEPYPFFTCWRV